MGGAGEMGGTGGEECAGRDKNGWDMRGGMGRAGEEWVGQEREEWMVRMEWTHTTRYCVFPIPPHCTRFTSAVAPA